MKKVIEIPNNKTTSEIVNFLFDAGYKSKDYNIKEVNGKNYIEPKVQMILAQDAIAFGFKIVEI